MGVTTPIDGTVGIHTFKTVTMKYEFKIHATNIPKMERGGADPYFKLYLDGDDDKIYKSEVCSNTLNPGFKTFHIEAKKFGSKQKKARLELKMYDHDVGSDDKIGKCHFQIEDHDHHHEAREPVVMLHD